MILVIDNYDSFTFNLIQYLKILGADTKIVANDEVTAEDVLSLHPDGVLISPGPGKPEDAGNSMAITKAVLGHIPLLGICLGHQILAAALGAHIVKAPSPQHGKVCQVSHNGCGVFKNLPNPMQVVRYHSLIVSDLPSELEICALAQNDHTVMGIRHKKFPAYGVQFHPEALLTDNGLELLSNFIKLMEQYKNNRCPES